MEVKIVVFPETKIALLEHRGSPERVLETAGIFIKWRKETGLSPVKTSKTFGIATMTPPSQLKQRISGSTYADLYPKISLKMLMV